MLSKVPQAIRQSSSTRMLMRRHSILPSPTRSRSSRRSPFGEYTSISALNLGYAPDFKEFLQGEFQFPISGGDCKGEYDVNLLRKIYPNATDVNVHLQPGTGYGLTLHWNATVCR